MDKWLLLPLCDKLVEKTRQGAVVEWVERMAVIARKADLALEGIAWSGSPKTVALEIVKFAERHCVVEQLRKALES